MTKTRVLTGIAIFFPAVYLIGWAPRWLFLIALIALVERGLYEYFLIARETRLKAFERLGYVAGLAICVVEWPDLYRRGVLELAVILVFMLLASVWALWMAPDFRSYTEGVAATFFGVFYVAFTLSCLFPLRFSDLGAGLASGRQIVFFLFAVICVGDICAYFTGRALGRRLLFPRVSPKKTLEGALGGLAGSVVVGWAWAQLFWQTKAWEPVILLALCVAVAGQAGDFVESALKRGANIKDSGAILPGHGGLLDRVDSMLFGAPALWLVLIVRHFIRV
ncbi:MAG: phosphatidate cytidylyltransferase [Terriglobia bacterium]